MRDLARQSVLVVEDEFIIAEEIARVLRDAGAQVIGPEPTVDCAMHRLASGPLPRLAVLDINLRGAPVFPIADVLQAAGIPFVFYTGYDVEGMPERFAAVELISKSSGLGNLVDLLTRPRPTIARRNPAPERDVVAMLPFLRRIAYQFARDPILADELLEQTLKEAMDRWREGAAQPSLRIWLVGLMQDAVSRRRH